MGLRKHASASSYSAIATATVAICRVSVASSYLGIPVCRVIRRIALCVQSLRTSYLQHFRGFLHFRGGDVFQPLSFRS